MEALGGQLLGSREHLFIDGPEEIKEEVRKLRTDSRKRKNAWGGLWAVEAEDLPEFENQSMELITEDEIRRVINILVDGKAKGVDGWSPAELRGL
eukprot:16114960-Heterocapsa_arctica.AAC.1